MKTQSKKWIIEKTENGKTVFIVDDIYAIATVSEICGKEKQESSAKLIAAAPDLLEALIWAAKALASEGWEVRDIPYKNAINAIKKATE